MPQENRPGLGEAAEPAGVGLLLIDFINDLGFEGGENLLHPAMLAAIAAGGLKRQARAMGIPVIYVNDNFGQWRSDFRATVAHCCRADSTGRSVTETLLPTEEDYFVLKPKNSGFFGTTLELLLQYLGIRTLVLTGLTGDNCVLFTAHDAYLRSFRLFVPEDAVASMDKAANDAALLQMRRSLKASTPRSAEVNLPELRRA